MSIFYNTKYVTNGINSKVDLFLQLFMWNLITDMKGPKDYLQIFKCSNENGKKIEHIQEVPEYKRQYLLYADTIFIGKIFVIDDGEHSVMMLAEEY